MAVRLTAIADRLDPLTRMLKINEVVPPHPHFHDAFSSVRVEVDMEVNFEGARLTFDCKSRPAALAFLVASISAMDLMLLDGKEGT